MKNESGTKEDITMLDALQRLWHHKAKRKPIVFVVTFPGVSRKVTFAKVWSRMDNDWQYLVKDGEYTPQFVYALHKCRKGATLFLRSRFHHRQDNLSRFP